MATVKFAGTINQVLKDGMDHPLGQCQCCRPQTHVSYRL